MLNWSRFVELIQTHQRFLLTSHVRPDCDAIGSEVAMAAILQHLGKEVLVVNPFAVPPARQFLDPEQRLKQLGTDVAVEQLDSYDVLMVLDTSAWVQLGAMGEVIRKTKATKVVLDHHQSGDDLGGEVFKDSQAEATGRLVIDAADQLGVSLTPEIARPAFAALAADTGWFRFSSTTSQTFRLAARLIDAGAVPDRLYQELYETNTLARLQLLGRTMARTRAEMDGRLVHTYIELADFKATGARATDSEDVVNTALSVGGTEVAVILVEQKTGGFKASLRSRSTMDSSRSPMDCSRVAKQFGGGGHKQAAGATLNEPLESARSKVLDAVRAAMR